MYQALVLNTAVTAAVIPESITTKWQSSDCADGRFYNTTASTNFTMDPDSFSLSEFSSCLNQTTYPLVAIDETVTYDSVITLAEGTTTNAQVLITLPHSPTNGYLGVVSTILLLGTNVNATSTTTLLDQNNDTINDAVLVTFASIVNRYDNVANAEDLITIRTTVVVSDVPSNIAGMNLTAVSQFNYSGGISSTQQTMKLVEPQLRMNITTDKTLVQAGDIITYTYTIQHTAASTSAALLIVVAKTLQPHLQLVNNTVSSNGVVNMAGDSNSIYITEASLDLGSTLIISYQALVLDTITTESTLNDNATVSWKSSNCNPGRNYTGLASNSVVTKGSNFSISVTSTCSPDTTYPNVTIMELVTYSQLNIMY
jgi:uncharacterized repeat protein (TIGR01451 family)